MRMSQITGERFSHSGAFGFGMINPQVPERSTPNITKAKPSADSRVPTRSRRTASSAGVSPILRAKARMITTTSTSPTNTHRHEAYVVNRPPMRGPAATAIAPAEATRPYALGRSGRLKFEAASATTAGMMRAAPIPSSSDQPINSMVRFWESAVSSEPHP
jgi:hypothetical protein